jgi:hypothetical protein
MQWFRRVTGSGTARGARRRQVESCAAVSVSTARQSRSSRHHGAECLTSISCVGREQASRFSAQCLRCAAGARAAARSGAYCSAPGVDRAAVAWASSRRCGRACLASIACGIRVSVRPATARRCLAVRLRCASGARAAGAQRCVLWRALRGVDRAVVACKLAAAGARCLASNSRQSRASRCDVKHLSSAARNACCGVAYALHPAPVLCAACATLRRSEHGAEHDPAAHKMWRSSTQHCRLRTSRGGRGLRVRSRAAVRNAFVSVACSGLGVAVASCGTHAMPGVRPVALGVAR